MSPTITTVLVTGTGTPAAATLPGGTGDASEPGYDDEGEEEEFDDGGVSGIQGSREDWGGVRNNRDDDLGGVVMPHDEMVAADRQQELPEASQGSIDVVEIMVGAFVRRERWHSTST